jgi:hypothetical protein
MLPGPDRTLISQGEVPQPNTDILRTTCGQVTIKVGVPAYDRAKSAHPAACCMSRAKLDLWRVVHDRSRRLAHPDGQIVRGRDWSGRREKTSPVRRRPSARSDLVIG